MAGWIKLHRKILDNPIFLKPGLFQLFSYCLLKANHKDKKILWNNKEEIIEKGSFVTGRKIIANDLKQSESTIYNRLKLLQKIDMISLKSNNKFSIINVLNYCIYQGDDEEDQQQTNNKPTTNQQQTNTTKNDKNIKNDKKINICPKKQFSESVTLTEAEYTKLIIQHGEEDTKRLIEILDNYKLSSGKKYKSDYHTIIGWVAKRLATEKLNNPVKEKNKAKNDKYEKFYL